MHADPQQRYAPPTAEVADVPSGDDAALGGRGARLLASVIDTVVLLALWGVVAWLTPWNIFSPRMASAGAATMIGLGLVGIVLFLAVNGVLLARSGQTVGKRRWACASRGATARPRAWPASRCCATAWAVC